RRSQARTNPTKRFGGSFRTICKAKIFSWSRDQSGRQAVLITNSMPLAQLAAKKAVVAFCDGSGQIMKVDTTSKTVNRPGHATSIFAAGTASDPWLDST